MRGLHLLLKHTPQVIHHWGKLCLDQMTCICCAFTLCCKFFSLGWLRVHWQSSRWHLTVFLKYGSSNKTEWPVSWTNWWKLLQVDRSMTLHKFCKFKKFKSLAATETGIPEARQLWLGFTKDSKGEQQSASPYMPSLIYGRERDEMPMCHFRDGHITSKELTCNLNLMLVVSATLTFDAWESLTVFLWHLPVDQTYHGSICIHWLTWTATDEFPHKNIVTSVCSVSISLCVYHNPGLWLSQVEWDCKGVIYKSLRITPHMCLARDQKQEDSFAFLSSHSPRARIPLSEISNENAF